jgi:hypothetical protein
MKPSCNIAAAIYDEVITALQPAEEIGGPDTIDYIALMGCLKIEIEERIANARQLLAEDQSKGK